MNARKKILIGIGGIIASIIIGALGSGLWERCFSRLFDGSVRVIVSLMSFLFKTYENGIYMDVAKGFHEYSSLFIHTMVLTLITFMYLMALLRHPYGRKKSSDFPKRTFWVSRKGYYLLAFLTFTVIVSFFLDLTRITYVNSVITTSRQSIAILAPKISDVETKELWALFYSMKSTADFNIFKTKLQELANKNSVKLPTFDGLWTRK